MPVSQALDDWGTDARRLDCGVSAETLSDAQFILSELEPGLCAAKVAAEAELSPVTMFFGDRHFTIVFTGARQSRRRAARENPRHPEKQWPLLDPRAFSRHPLKRQPHLHRPS